MSITKSWLLEDFVWLATKCGRGNPSPTIWGASLLRKFDSAYVELQQKSI